MESSRQQKVLYELAETMNRAEALSEVFDKALEAITTTLNADRAAIFLVDSEGVMQLKASRGLSDQNCRLVADHSPWPKDSVDVQPIMVQTITESEMEPQLQAAIQHEGIGALGFIPLTYGGRLLGKVMVYFNSVYNMDEHEIDLAQAIARTLALGIERKRAETCLRDSEERFRSIFDNAAMGVALVALDGRWLRVNDTLCEMIGYSREELLTKTVFEITHPDDLESGSSLMRTASGWRDSDVYDRETLLSQGYIAVVGEHQCLVGTRRAGSTSVLCRWSRRHEPA